MSVSGWSNGRVQFFLAGQNSNFEICEGATQRPGHEEPWCAYGMPMLCHSAIAVDARKLSVIQYDILWHDCDMIVTWLWSHVITMGIIIIRIYKNHKQHVNLTNAYHDLAMRRSWPCVGQHSGWCQWSRRGQSAVLRWNHTGHHSSDPHSSGRRNNRQMCHQMRILAEVSSSACWARNPFPASQAHNGRLVAVAGQLVTAMPQRNSCRDPRPEAKDPKADTGRGAVLQGRKKLTISSISIYISIYIYISINIYILYIIISI